jgi:hypothetical protein
MLFAAAHAVHSEDDGFLFCGHVVAGTLIPGAPDMFVLYCCYSGLRSDLLLQDSSHYVQAVKTGQSSKRTQIRFPTFSLSKRHVWPFSPCLLGAGNSCLHRVLPQALQVRTEMEALPLARDEKTQGWSIERSLKERRTSCLPCRSSRRIFRGYGEGPPSFGSRDCSRTLRTAHCWGAHFTVCATRRPWTL